MIFEAPVNNMGARTELPGRATLLATAREISGVTEVSRWSASGWLQWWVRIRQRYGEFIFGDVGDCLGPPRYDDVVFACRRRGDQEGVTRHPGWFQSMTPWD